MCSGPPIPGHRILLQEDGGRGATACQVPSGGEDGRYHVEGDSVFAPKELQYSIFNQAKPLMQLARDLMKILICPLPRYLKDRCCDNKMHVPNLEDDNYGANLEDAVLASRKNLKDFAFRQGLCSMQHPGAGSLVQPPETQHHCVGGRPGPHEQRGVQRPGGVDHHLCQGGAWDGGRWLKFTSQNS